MSFRRLVCSSLLLCVPLWAWPQTPEHNSATQETKASQPNQSEAIKRNIQKRGTGEKSRVRVTLRDKSELKGYISNIDAEAFQVSDRKTGRATTVAYQDVERVRGSGLSVGAKIAIVAGVAVGIVVIAALASLQASGE
jgi:hypothetical protein